MQEDRPLQTATFISLEGDGEAMSRPVTVLVVILLFLSISASVLLFFTLGESVAENEALATQNAELAVEVDSLQVQLEEIEDALSGVQAELQFAEEKLEAIESDSLHLHNPAFREAIGFMTRDKTNSNKYIEGEYVCSHFARDVNNNAEEQGLRCAIVDIRFPDGGHAIIAFETVDKGLIYFDPQTDERVNPVAGKRYWQCIEPRPGYYYEQPSYDDTIMDVLVSW